MAVIYNAEDRTFTLQTNRTTYQMQVDPYGFLLHLYYGKSVQGCMDYLLTYYDRGFSGNPYDAGEDRTYSMDVLPQEFPCRGSGDYRSPSLSVENADGTYSCDMRYKGHVIREGKYSLPGLPAVYAKDEEAQTLEITLEDSVSGLRAVLFYGVLEEPDIITRSVRIENGGGQKLYLDKVYSACLDFVYGEFDLLTFYGRHAMERMMQRSELDHGSRTIGSRRGTSSHQYNPVMILAEKETGEEYGNCCALTLMYSGGFKGEAERDQFNQTRVQMGLQEEMFRYPLEPGESFQAPEAILTFSSEGLSQLSYNMHRCIREHVCRGEYQHKPRPVLVNSWEASYFNFTGESILELAREAKDLGIEMLVMDDGWFGNRDDDNSSLGDWHVNEEKLGCTLGELVQQVNDLGLKFGIWIEPEMISEKSELYHRHPEWAFVIPGRKPNRGRNQLVLDFSRKDVVDYLFDQICKILDQGNIEYVKWDMNRSITDVYSAKAEEQGKVAHEYVLGLYDFLERLGQKYPHILIEGCSGGGGRFDAGMLYYTPQIWCSDNTDAIDRLQIQYGTSFIYPASTVGAHVSAVPNHQTGRITSMQTRSIVAMGGTFGYELDLAGLSEEDRSAIRRDVELYHRYEGLIRNGRHYRLSEPGVGEFTAWEFAAEDGSEALLSAVMTEVHANSMISRVRLKGLCPERRYREESSGKLYWGSSLMEGGIALPMPMGEYLSYQIHFVREE